MSESILTTPVDEMLQTIEIRGEISSKELSKLLNVPQQVIEMWGVILEEKKVILSKYKMFKLFFLRNPNNQKAIDFADLKQSFLDNYLKRGAGYKQVKSMWEDYVKTREKEFRDEFEKRLPPKKLSKEQIERGWEKFKKEFETL